jgi:two-component system phosphate regulon response regulator PhoB
MITPEAMKKILVVEDNREFAERIANALILNGYIVCIASNGDRGQQSLFSYRPDLIISDVLRCGISGIELLDLIRKDIKYFKLPFILLSDNTSENYVLDGNSIGATMFHKRSCDFNDLVLSVSQLLK